MSSVDKNTDDWWLEMRKESTGEWIEWLCGTYEEMTSELFEWRSGHIYRDAGYDRARITAPEKAI